MIFFEKTYIVVMGVILHDGKKLEIGKVETSSMRKAVRARREYNDLANKHGDVESYIEFACSTRYSVNNVKPRHVRELDEFEDPCAGCGGWGGGWVRECYGCTHPQDKWDYINRYAPVFK